MLPPVQLTPVESLEDPRLADYRNVRDPELLKRSDLFMCEGRLGVRHLLDGGRYVPRSVFVTQTALDALSDAWPKLPRCTPIYLGSQALLNQVVGFNLHRGCLAAVARGAALESACVLAGCDAARAALLLVEVSNPDNVGGIFRSAAAFGAGAVWLTPGCADPLYRKATRVSMGGTLSIPFARVAQGVAAIGELRDAGRTVVALTPDPRAESIDDVSRRLVGEPVALAFGAEDAGLPPDALAAADVRCRIPLAEGVDSLNVATAAGIALHRFSALGPHRARPPHRERAGGASGA